MAKDDYHVIAYRILAYLYACIKAGERPNMNEISFDKLKISELYWLSVIKDLYDKGYITGITPYVSCGITKFVFDMPVITMDGVEFLQDNSKMQKAKEIVMTLLDYVPLF